MTKSISPSSLGVLARPVLNKVPEVTIYFWIIKILCTTVGESAADFLNVNMGWGLSGTSVATGIVLAIVLTTQVSLRRYIPAVYWLTVMLVSVFGTLVTDNLTDNLGVPLQVSTIVFSVLLALVFIAWYLSEKTLSIHSILTRRREMFYWLTIFVTFALGTAVGDLVSEGLGVGYLRTGLLMGALIALVTLGWRLGLNAILAFWIAYILTRPLGASIGDLMAQTPDNGGLGLGTTTTSLILLALIVGVITYLSIRKPDVIPVSESAVTATPASTGSHSALIQTIAVVGAFIVFGGAFYAWRTSVLNSEASAAVAQVSATGSPLGDVSEFVTISQDSLDLLNAGDQGGATARIGDLEAAWDKSAALLKRTNPDEWTLVDNAIDKVLRELRATSPNNATEVASLQALLTQLGQ